MTNDEFFSQCRQSATSERLLRVAWRGYAYTDDIEDLQVAVRVLSPDWDHPLARTVENIREHGPDLAPSPFPLQLPDIQSIVQAAWQVVQPGPWGPGSPFAEV